MQVQAELDKDFAKELAAALVPMLEPIIEDKVKTKLMMERPLNKKQLARDVLACSPEKVEEFIQEGLPFYLVGSQMRFIPSETRNWLVKHQKSYG